jgi:hypothetical protein
MFTANARRAREKLSPRTPEIAARDRKSFLSRA